MQNLLLIGAGGAAGAVLRYALSILAYRLLGETFPWGTLIVNVLGCLLIGVFWAVAERSSFSSTVYLFILTGVLGAFTTFSTYGLETFNLIRDGRVVLGLANFLAANVLGIGGVAAAYFTIKTFFLGGGAP